MVEGNLNLVRNLARRFSVPGIDPEDLFQIGCIGLIKAADRFDPSFGTAFSTYAVPLIIGEIRCFLREDGPIKLGRAAKGLARRVRERERDLRAELQREPSLAEIAASLGADAAEIAGVLEACEVPLSLQGGGPEAKPLEEFLADRHRWEDGAEMRVALGRLPPRERAIIALRFFLDRTQAEIGRLLGISQVQVSRLEKRALAELRRQLTVS